MAACTVCLCSICVVLCEGVKPSSMSASVASVLSCVKV